MPLAIVPKNAHFAQSEQRGCFAHVRLSKGKPRGRRLLRVRFYPTLVDKFVDDIDLAVGCQPPPIGGLSLLLH